MGTEHFSKFVANAYFTVGFTIFSPLGINIFNLITKEDTFLTKRYCLNLAVSGGFALIGLLLIIKSLSAIKKLDKEITRRNLNEY